MAQESITEEDLAELIRGTEEAAALMRGDMSTYLAHIKHADDYTLMAPFDGEPTCGFDASPKRLATMARFFQAGRARLELL
jgi:hypothetical protein